MDVIHTCIWVSDMDAAREFYLDGIGLEEHRSATLGGVENVWLGGEHGEIQLRYAEDHPDPAPDRGDFDHLALSVDDVDGEVERIVDNTGATVLDGPRTVDVAEARIAFLEGFDGYVIELVEDLS
jgi:lactoylglutathione lyase